MSGVLYNLTTAALMIFMYWSGLALVDPETIVRRRVPWWAAGLTALVVAGLVLQLSWSGAMDALDADPSRPGWWRVVTSVFMQNGGVLGDAWNLVTIAVIAALAEWLFTGPAMLGLFAAGILLPRFVDELLGLTTVFRETRNFAGSSGATYFLGATIAALALLRGRGARARLLGLAVPVLGLTVWFAQDNAHGLLATYGFALGLFVALAAGRRLRPERDLERAQRLTVGALIRRDADPVPLRTLATCRAGRRGAR